MALNIGDKVKFLNEAGGGKVTQLIDKDTVMVLSDIDDFEIPMLISELVAVGGGQQSVKNVALFDKKTTISKDVEKQQSAFLFTESKKEYECFLCNGQPSAMVFGVFEEQKNRIQGLKSGILQAGSVEKLAVYSLKELDEIDQWRFQGFYFEKKPSELTVPMDCVVKMNPKKFFSSGKKKFIEQIGKEAIVIPLEQKKPLELKAEDFFAADPKEEKKTASKKSKRKDTKELLEVDLHIHELLETTSGMSSGEMLGYQMDTFEKVLKENAKFKGKRIVFIHGVGNGVLKQRIRHHLQKHPRYLVQDASFQEYGWGATMVIIK